MPLPRSAHLVIRAILAPGRRQSLLLIALLLLGTLLLLALSGAGTESGAAPDTETATTGMIERDLAPADPEPVTVPVAPAIDEFPTAVLPEPLPDFRAAPAQGADIVLIIDDLGNSLGAGQRALALPADITFAVLPHTPHAHTLAEQAHTRGKELMLHAPMSNLSRMPLGPGGLTPELNEEDFRHVLEESLAAVPHIKGVNNHTGSDLTARQQPMQWLMDTLGSHQLYFVDSLTTKESVAGDTAAKNGIPFLRRHVFLDHSTEPVAIDSQFRRLLDIARRDGLAVGIGHPYPQTMEYLEQVLPELDALGYRLRFVSDVLPSDGAGSGEITPGP